MLYTYSGNIQYYRYTIGGCGCSTRLKKINTNMRLFEVTKFNENSEDKLSYIVNALEKNPNILDRVYKMIKTDPIMMRTA